MRSPAHLVFCPNSVSVEDGPFKPPRLVLQPTFQPGHLSSTPRRMPPRFNRGLGLATHCTTNVEYDRRSVQVITNETITPEWEATLSYCCCRLTWQRGEQYHPPLALSAQGSKVKGNTKIRISHWGEQDHPPMFPLREAREPQTVPILFSRHLTLYKCHEPFI